VARAIRTLNIAAEEALLNTSKKNIFGDRESVIHPFPIGVCSFITPFNFPLNLAMHKIAPALAAGCPFVLKPAEKTPLTALLLGEALCRVDPPLPKGSWSILPALPDECGPLSDSPLVRHLSFTGSAGVGWELKGRAAHAHTTLELGGNAAAILCEDWNLEDALNRCTIGAFAYSGQVCISLQRLLVPQGIQGEVIDGLGQRIRDLRLGSLSEMETDFGPMIDEASAIRVESWIREAIQEGAQLHCGGNRVGNFVEPTLLSQVSHNSKVWDEEIFGPVLVVEEWSDFSKALDAVNETRWGLQAALFTHNEQRINSAFRNLEVGQVIIGDSTVFRVDDMPYGGVKASGCGREGVRWAMEAMQETRLLVRAPKS
jgi:acyl-CoA reductase-like NAD-dependent aldehyde dehydrogenase